MDPQNNPNSYLHNPISNLKEFRLGPAKKTPYFIPPKTLFQTRKKNHTSTPKKPCFKLKLFLNPHKTLFQDQETMFWIIKKPYFRPPKTQNIIAQLKKPYPRSQQNLIPIPAKPYFKPPKKS